jgi:hypothetical protein
MWTKLSWKIAMKNTKTYQEENVPGVAVVVAVS